MPNWKKVIVSGSNAHLNSVTGSSGVQLADDAVLNIGDGNDLQLYHDGSNSYIKDAGTGALFYRGGTQTFQNAAGSKTMAVFNAANSVDLNYNNSTKFQTTNTGISVTGNVVSSGNISGSSTSTGSFGRVQASVIGGNSPIRIEADNFNVSTDGTVSGSATSTGSFGRLNVGGDGTSGRTIARFGKTQVAAGTNVGDAGARYVFNVDAVNPQVGVGIIAQNHNPHHLAILNKTYRSDGNFNYGFTLNQDNSGNAEIYVANNKNIELTGGIDGHMELTRGSANFTLGGSIFAGGNISGSSVSSSGDILADGDVVAFNSSDMRLKNNLQVIEGALDKIDGINGYEFDWNEQSPGWARQRGHDVGVVAQEIQKIHPEIVEERKNGYLGVDYKRLVPLLIQSIKELKQEVEELKKKV